MKRFFNNSCAKLFALFCILAFGVGNNAWGLEIPKDTWKSLGVNDATLPSGNYYILSYGAGKFLKRGSNAGLAADEKSADVFTKDASGYLGCTKSTSTTYIWMGKTTTNDLSKGATMDANNKTQLSFTRQSDNLYKISGTATWKKGSTSTGYLACSTSGAQYTKGGNSGYPYETWVFIPETTFNAQKPKYYFEAEARVSGGTGGSVKCSFTTPIPGAATSASTIEAKFGVTPSAPATITAYFTAEAAEGAQFKWWSLTEGGEEYNSNPTCSVELTSSTSGSENATSITLYAVFESESADCELYDANNEKINEGSLADMVTAANSSSNTKIVLMKNLDDVSETLTFTKTTTLDLNGYRLSGASSLSNLLNVNSSTAVVTITDGASGGLMRLEANAAAHVITLKATAGTLQVNSGEIRVSNASSNASAKASAVYAATGTTAYINTADSIVAKGAGNISAIYGNGTITIADGAKIRSAADGAYSASVICENTAAEITIGAAKLIATATANAYGVWAKNGTVTLDGTILRDTTTTGSFAVNVLADGASADVTIDNGDFRAEAKDINARSVWANNGRITMNSGSSLVYGRGDYVNGARNIVQSGSGHIVVNGGRFKGYSANQVAEVQSAVLANLVLNGGYYRNDNNLDQWSGDGKTVVAVLEGTAEYLDGYYFTIASSDNPNAGVCTADGKIFTTLEDAIAYANNNTGKTMTIRMKSVNYTLSAGNYTLPANATLLIPYSKGQSNSMETIERVDGTSGSAPYVFCTLTFASGVNMDVKGTIEAGGIQMSGAQGGIGAGVPRGSYGMLKLNENSHLTLNNNAKLRAWGYVIGAGTIDVRRGAKVYEQFQMYDWKGGTYSSDMLKGNNKSTYKVFPVSQYFIQNVESPTTYHPGAELICATSIYVADNTVASNTVKIIGTSGAMFLMDDKDDSEDTWVRKSYDIAHDQQVYDVNSSAHLGSMTISFDVSGGISNILSLVGYGDIENFSSTDYTLPITNNLKIHILTGDMDITQSTVMLPGSQIEVDKEATITLNPNQALYLYDSDNWGQHVFSNAWAQRIYYRPEGTPTNTQRNISSASALGDASVNVHGTFDVKGAIYTTAGGANIYSSIADAGTVQFTTAAAANKNVYQWTTSDYVAAACTSAKLKNNTGSTYSDGDGFTETVGTTSGRSFCFIDIDDDEKGEWVSLVTDGCFVHDNSNDIYYAKPADYVALANGKTENADHTYSSADGTRSFIVVGNCQWWEVEYDEESGLYYCDKNGIYYYYDDSNPNPDFQEWKEKTYTVTWKNWNGATVDTYQDIPHGSMPKYLGTNPSRAKDSYYTYDFIGWAPALSPVTGDVTYVAQYDRKDVLYSVTFKSDASTTIETSYWRLGEIPYCYNAPDMTGKEWSPAISAVTGNTTYTLQAQVAKSNYTINWKNWNGTTLQSTTPAAGTAAADVLAGYTAGTPTKTALSDIAFEFAGWSPTVVDANADAVYTATFTEQPITYTILWKNYDGTTLETDENVAPNAVPQYNGATPTKPSDDEYHYQFAGWTPAVVAATENTSYTAIYNAIPKDKIVDGETYNVPTSTQQTVTNLIIKDDGIVNIPSTSRINAENLIIEATNNESGQLVANANTCINPANAYFDWTMNGSTGTVNRTWYAIAVPWEVNAETGIFIKDGRHLVLGSDFDLVWYDGEERAARGDSYACWKYVELESDKIMLPGRLYMMYFGPTGIQTVRFAKAAGAAVIYTNPISVETYTLGTGVTTDGNWNGIANPRTYYASLGTGASYAQVLNNGSLDDYQVNHPEGNPVYKTINLASSTFNVGKPLFVQAVNPQPVVVTKETTANIVYNAPKRERVATLPEGIDAVFAVTIGTETNHAADNLFIQVAEEDKADEYIIGQDLSKGGVAKMIPQLWVNRYNTKLSVNTQSLTNETAEYPLTLFAPRAGEYTISNQSSVFSDQYTLYLTFNGEAIWNLSNSDYTFSLPQGNTTNYGLRVSARAPQITTGIDEAVVDAKGETRKVLIDNQVFIIRGEKVYSVDGQLVK